MTENEIFEMKKEDIRGALNLSLIWLDDVQDLGTLKKKTEILVRILITDIEVMENVPKFLELQSSIIGDR